MSSESEDCTAVGKLFHTRAAVELNARPPMVTCSVRGGSRGVSVGILPSRLVWKN